MNSRSTKIGLTSGGIASLAALYYWVDPENTVLLPCPFHYLTGLHCPLCGSQRALHHLMHGELQLAFWTNPLLIAGILIAILFLVYRWINSGLGQPSKIRLLSSEKLTYTSIGIIVLFWIARNLSIYPFELLSPEVFP